MESYVLFRLPGELEYTEMIQTNGEPLRFSDIQSLNGKSGFVIAPFAATEECPVLLLCPDEVMRHSLPYMKDYDYAPEGNLLKRVSSRDTYNKDFNAFHSYPMALSPRLCLRDSR